MYQINGWTIEDIDTSTDETLDVYDYQITKGDTILYCMWSEQWSSLMGKDLVDYNEEYGSTRFSITLKLFDAAILYHQTGQLKGCTQNQIDRWRSAYRLSMGKVNH